MNKQEYDAVYKVINWFEAQAKRDEIQAKNNTRFPSLNKAYIADAKNYRAMAKDLKDVAIWTVP